MQRIAANMAVSLAAVETLPTTTAGNWHKVSLRISLSAPWPVLMDLLQSIGDSLTPVDDIHFHSATMVTHPTVLPVQASMVLYGFRSSQADSGT
jgi:hypothetical protein